MSITVHPVPGIPEVRAGDDVAAQIIAAAQAGPGLEGGDLLVVTQKIVSKAEGRVVSLNDVSPSPAAEKLAAETEKDARLVELILRESRGVVRMGHGVMITETRHGFICANAGVDASNVERTGTVCLLPLDSDASAQRIRERVNAAFGVGCAVIVSDSFGRAWRMGQAEIAVGCAGLAPTEDWRGLPDAHGRTLHATHIAIADEAASAADVVRGKDSREPAVRLRGLERHVLDHDGPGAAALVRAAADDLFA